MATLYQNASQRLAWDNNNPYQLSMFPQAYSASGKTSQLNLQTNLSTQHHSAQLLNQSDHQFNSAAKKQKQFIGTHFSTVNKRNTSQTRNAVIPASHTVRVPNNDDGDSFSQNADFNQQPTKSQLTFYRHLKQFQGQHTQYFLSTQPKRSLREHQMRDTQSFKMLAEASEKKLREDTINKIESQVQEALSTLKPSGKKTIEEDHQQVLTDQDIGKYLRNVQRTVYNRLNPNQNKKRKTTTSDYNFTKILNKSNETRRHSLNIMNKREHGHSFKFKRELATLAASKHKSMLGDVSQQGQINNRLSQSPDSNNRQSQKYEKSSSSGNSPFQLQNNKDDSSSFKSRDSFGKLDRKQLDFTLEFATIEEEELKLNSKNPQKSFVPQEVSQSSSSRGLKVESDFALAQKRFHSLKNQLYRDNYLKFRQNNNLDDAKDYTDETDSPPQNMDSSQHLKFQLKPMKTLKPQKKEDKSSSFKAGSILRSDEKNVGSSENNKNVIKLKVKKDNSSSNKSPSQQLKNSWMGGDDQKQSVQTFSKQVLKLIKQGTQNEDMTVTSFGPMHNTLKSGEKSTVTGEKMKSYFQYREIGQITGILRDKYNLFQDSPGDYERKPLYQPKDQQSKVEDIDSSFFSQQRDRVYTFQNNKISKYSTLKEDDSKSQLSNFSRVAPKIAIRRTSTVANPPQNIKNLTHNDNLSSSYLSPSSISKYYKRTQHLKQSSKGLLLNQNRSKINELLAEERSSNDSDSNDQEEDEEGSGTTGRLASEHFHRSKEKSSGGITGTSKVNSQVLSQLYRDKNFQAIANLNKDEKMKNRFVSVETDFLDFNNLNTSNILDDMQKLNETKVHMDILTGKSDVTSQHELLLTKVDKADMYCRPINFDKSDFKQLNLQFLMQTEEAIGENYKERLEEARHQENRKISVPGEIRNQHKQNELDKTVNKLVQLIVNERQGIRIQPGGAISNNTVEVQEQKNSTFQQFMKDHRPLIKQTMTKFKKEANMVEFDKIAKQVDPQSTINHTPLINQSRNPNMTSYFAKSMNQPQDQDKIDKIKEFREKSINFRRWYLKPLKRQDYSAIKAKVQSLIS